jgi:hypothetical protein
LEEYLDAVDLNIIDLNAVDQAAVNLVVVHWKRGTTEAVMLFIHSLAIVRILRFE